MDLHHQYALKFVNQTKYAAKNAEGGWTTTFKEEDAWTSWSRSGAARHIDEFLGAVWNPTMGTPPEFEVVKVKRPVRMHVPW